jgi:hypothetical protein
VVVAAVAVNANPAPKVRASPALRAMHHRHHAATAHKAHLALKARAMVAAMAAVMATAKAVVAKSSVAIRVLTTGVTAKAVPHPVAHVLKVVVRPEVVKAAKVAVKTVAATMAMNCHATSIR